MWSFDRVDVGYKQGYVVLAWCMRRLRDSRRVHSGSMHAFQRAFEGDGRSKQGE